MNPNYKQDLIPLNQRSEEERRDIARKGGMARSERKRFANSIKNLKHGRYSKYFKGISLDLIKNRDSFSVYLLKNIFELEKLDLTVDEKIALLGVMIRAFKVIYGTKIRSENFNVNKDESITGQIDRILEEYQETKT